MNLPLNSRTQVRELPCNDVNKDHEIIGVEVMNAVICREDIKHEFVNGVWSSASTNDGRRVIFAV